MVTCHLAVIVDAILLIVESIPQANLLTQAQSPFSSGVGGRLE
jgi:hypothetical protein